MICCLSPYQRTCIDGNVSKDTSCICVHNVVEAIVNGGETKLPDNLCPIADIFMIHAFRKVIHLSFFYH